MIKFNFFLALSAALGVAACGGSGSGGSVADGSDNNSGPNQPDQPQPTNAKFSGYSINFLNNGSEDFAPLEVKDRNVLIVDGNEYLLKNPGITARSFYSFGDRVISGEYLSYARFGIFAPEGLNNKRAVLFAQGETTPTAEVPTTGNATYSGLAVHVNNPGVDERIRVNSDSTAKFDVDFGAKKLTGKINVPDRDSIPLQATIAGNTFSGSLDGTQTRGGFYGANAQEIAGTYLNKEDKFSGAYGLNKQSN